MTTITINVLADIDHVDPLRSELADIIRQTITHGYGGSVRQLEVSSKPDRVACPHCSGRFRRLNQHIAMYHPDKPVGCSVAGCDENHHGAGYCMTHYYQARKGRL